MGQKMARKFDQHGYPVRPYDISEDSWYYIQKRGLLVIWRGKGSLVLIPWRRIKQALLDHEKAPRRAVHSTGRGKS